VTPEASTAAQEARDLYESGDYERAREVAAGALDSTPEDVELLRLAGRATLELEPEAAVAYFERAAHVEPENAELWDELGDVLLQLDRAPAATSAFQQVIRLRPDDAASHVDLAHAAFRAGDGGEAVASLERAVERDPANAAALRALVDVHRRSDRAEDALGAATTLAEQEPEDVLALIDVAELSLELGRVDDAVAAYSRLRDVDDDPEHAVYPYYGMIQAELRRGGWRRALDLAIDATRVDRLGRTTDVLAFAVAKVFGHADRPAPSRDAVDAALAEAQAEHRRLHAQEVPI
jgi:tetratricopeptide (TPR) repeat protein